MTDPAVKLITLLNVSSGRRAIKRKYGEDWHEIAKKAKADKKPSLAAAITSASVQSEGTDDDSKTLGKSKDSAVADISQDVTVEEDDDEPSEHDPYKRHFDTEPVVLTPEALDAVKNGFWKTATTSSSVLGSLVRSSVAEDKSESLQMKPVLHPRLKEKFDGFVKQQASSALPTELLNLIGNYSDLLYSKRSFDNQPVFKRVIATHAVNHVNKTRQRILKNNEALAHAAAEGKTTDRETRDQGYTRPKVLILVPFRNAALDWMNALTDTSLSSQIENYSRFKKDFALPEGVVDKLAMDEKDFEGNSKFPRDHRENFKGNIDDSFRVGVKFTRKSLKLYSEFYQSDLIIASPLGLRMSIEKEKDSDFLSSIEIAIADQLDVMSMQNWEHLQFVFKHLNEIPKEAHGCDFARVKPWYLDGQAAYLRQTILTSAYETPEIRNLFNKSLTNLAGKYRTLNHYEDGGVLSRIRPGVKQTFMRFDATSALNEIDERFEYFTTKTLPALRKSAVASQNTLIFVPSYFDFVRLNAYLKKLDDFDYAVLSEYSSNSEISRARTNFFNGKKAFLVVTERFHFFRRYKIRGARTVVFYAPPEHADFYAEFLQYPFLRREVSGSSKNKPDAEMVEEQLEAGEVSSQCVFSRYDFLRLERIVGTNDAKRMCSRLEGERFSFV